MKRHLKNKINILIKFLGSYFRPFPKVTSERISARYVLVRVKV